jgi:Eukaryotic aspartyl protease
VIIQLTSQAYAKALRKYNITPMIDGPFLRLDDPNPIVQAKRAAQDKARQSGLSKSLPEPRGALMKRNPDLFAAHDHGKGKTVREAKPSKPPVATAPTATPSTSPTPITAQDIQDDSEYLAPVCVGTPWRQHNLDFDTGSSDLWILGPTAIVGVLSPPPHNIYNPTQSSSAKLLPGETFTITYGDNSYASGIVYSDRLNLGGTTVTCQAIEMTTVCSSSFVTSPGDGLMVRYLTVARVP